MIKVTLEFSYLVPMQSEHTRSYIFFFFATFHPFAKAIIEYNSISSEENDEVEEEPIDIEFT